MSLRSWLGMLVYAGILLAIEPGLVHCGQNPAEQEEEQKPIGVLLEECRDSVHLTVTELGQPGVELIGSGGRNIQLHHGTLYVACPRERPFHFRTLVLTDQYVEVSLKVEENCVVHSEGPCNIVELRTGRHVQIEDLRGTQMMIHDDTEEQSSAPHGFTQDDSSKWESLLSPNPFEGSDTPEGIWGTLKRELLRAATNAYLGIPVSGQQIEVIEGKVIPTNGVILGPIEPLEEPAWKPVPKKPQPRQPSRPARGVLCQK